MSETPRTDSLKWIDDSGVYVIEASEFKVLEKELTALQAENTRLRAAIAAKTEALKHVLEVSAEPERHGRFLTTADREIVKSAISPNPPVYVPGEIVAKLVEAIERQLPVNKEVNKLPIGNFYLPETIEGFLGDALALARPFITKGAK